MRELSYISPKWLRNARKRPKHSVDKIMELVTCAVIDSGFKRPVQISYSNEEYPYRHYSAFKFRSGDFIMTRSFRVSPVRPKGLRQRFEYQFVFQKKDPKLTITSVMLDQRELKEVEDRISELIKASRVLKGFINDYVIPHIYKPPHGKMFIREMTSFEKLIEGSVNVTSDKMEPVGSIDKDVNNNVFSG